ncbi:LOW QUALITY PROTEIN: uncharacterized protein ACR2FA_012674 [Aphomia sociella]
MMTEQEKLIELVKRRPLLYDLCHSDNKNRNMKAKAWLEIAHEMGSGDGSIWSYKWKGLKDNYTKYKKQEQISETSTGQLYRKYKNWPWAEHMKFLDNFNTVKRTTNNRGRAYGHGEDTYTSDSQHNDQCTTENQHSTNDNQVCRDTFENASGSGVKTNLKNTALTDERVCIDQFDGTDYFFLSYSQSFKKFPRRMQTMLKLEIATLFARYETFLDEGHPGASLVAQNIMNEEYVHCDQESLSDPLTGAIKLENE